jgi:hypothetical protein
MMESVYINIDLIYSLTSIFALPYLRTSSVNSLFRSGDFFLEFVWISVV